MTAKRAFEIAIAQGVLSANPDDGNYAGFYMFMGVENAHTDYEQLAFKHILTRKYIRF